MGNARSIGSNWPTTQDSKISTDEASLRAQWLCATPCRHNVASPLQPTADFAGACPRGQLQEELAQLEYQLPRLAGRGRAMPQLGGGIGTRVPGETQLETDRGKINLRIDHIKTQLDAVRRIRHQQRQRREAVPVPVVALVGYTHAGKSTLFNALTEAGVLESARMFATLDPKLRQLQLPSRRKILLSDTVGFILRAEGPRTRGLF